MTIVNSCCCTVTPCTIPFKGGYSCGSRIMIQADWSAIQRKTFDPWYPIAQCFGVAVANSQTNNHCTCDDLWRLCDQGQTLPPSPRMEATYCAGGTLPCGFGDINPQNVCDGCFQNWCVGSYSEPIYPGGFQHSHEWAFCVDRKGYSNPPNMPMELRRSGSWVPTNNLPIPQCNQPLGAGNPNAFYPRCGELVDVNMFVDNLTSKKNGGSANGGCCVGVEDCSSRSTISQMILADNQGIWKVGYCRDLQGNLLYPQRYLCGSEMPVSCPNPSDNICTEDKSYCAMASQTMQNLSKGWHTTASLERHLRTTTVGATPESFEVTEGGSGYEVDQNGTPVRLTWVSGGNVPKEFAEPWVVISSVDKDGAITGVQIPLNGGGMGTVVGAIYSVPISQASSGDGLALLLVEDIEPWNSTDNPWFRIHLRTLDDSHTKLQDPVTNYYDFTTEPAYQFHLDRCKAPLNPEPANYCIYKGCVATPFPEPCPPTWELSSQVTAPSWQWTNHSSEIPNDFSADLNPLGMTILDAQGRPKKTPWVTLALLRFWTWDAIALEMVKFEESYHCFGTQQTFVTWWNTDVPPVGEMHSQYALCEIGSSFIPLWLGLRADKMMEIPTRDLQAGEFQGQWYDPYHPLSPDYFCNALQGWRGNACCFAPGCTGKGTWIPDNSDEWRIKSMTAHKVELEARPRYWYGFGMSIVDSSMSISKMII